MTMEGVSTAPTLDSSVVEVDIRAVAYDVSLLLDAIDAVSPLRNEACELEKDIRDGFRKCLNGWTVS